MWNWPYTIYPTVIHHYSTAQNVSLFNETERSLVFKIWTCHTPLLHTWHIRRKFYLKLNAIPFLVSNWSIFQVFKQKLYIRFLFSKSCCTVPDLTTDGDDTWWMCWRHNTDSPLCSITEPAAFTALAAQPTNVRSVQDQYILWSSSVERTVEQNKAHI
jgi:hypothetical protein